MTPVFAFFSGFTLGFRPRVNPAYNLRLCTDVTTQTFTLSAWVFGTILPTLFLTRFSHKRRVCLCDVTKLHAFGPPGYTVLGFTLELLLLDLAGLLWP